MRKRARALAASMAVATTAAFGGLLALAPTASAASLVQITNFGSNPGNNLMYEYVPSNAGTHPAILVALHQCTGTGPGFYSSTEFASLANQYGFVVIYPDANRSGQCWDVSSSQALTHNGGSDPSSIVSMVQYVEQHNGGDSSRVYVTGASSGAMMTDVLLGSYPDVFKAGAAFMGVPFHCFYTGTVDGWNSACANGQVSNTPQAWGDYVRNAYPGYGGARPRVQLWHGTADGTLNYNNFGEEIKQWTNVLGVSQTPTSTSTLNGTWTHTTYGSSTSPVVDAYSISGAGHVLPQSGMAAYAIHFFGLDGSTPPSSAPPSTTPPSTTPPSTTPPSTTPPSTTPPPPGGCHVADVINSWNTGLTSNLTITNNGSTAINGWKLTFTLPSGQAITSVWNSTITPSSGAVTATNLSYNATITANGGTTTLGFNANQTGNISAPTSFALNGTACSVS
ncbi:MAG TPA: PHB depolymerase family esterase [Actinocrinis sp.]|uniref:extracellular catalytic domain type 1 short-chain-length polyhydroxyalkanoate depolymerase n=1 Tax=Actinocrinis sp. TaxID=1920516 RepID=UPI002DDD20C6|nr:PHB depolymerase family esterase [Actinocrinis sp.]HEV2347864.1 PHB depolymerase family esterase [Actinocrinis sp.]